MLFIIKSTYQVGLELIEVNVEGSVKPLQKDLLKYFPPQFLGICLVHLKTPEFDNFNAAQHVFVQPQGGGDGGDNLSDHAVEVGVSWRWDLQVVLAQIIDRLPIAIDQLNIEWKQEGLPLSQFSTWLSTRNAQSQCSRVVCVYSTALYGSTRAVDT